MVQLITEWSTNDPQLAAMLRSIQDEPDPVLRLELEAGLHTWQAQHCIRLAERAREHQRRYPRRRKSES